VAASGSHDGGLVGVARADGDGGGEKVVDGTGTAGEAIDPEMRGGGGRGRVALACVSSQQARVVP